MRISKDLVRIRVNRVRVRVKRFSGFGLGLRDLQGNEIPLTLTSLSLTSNPNF
jgi:hypothetical protein